MRPTRTPREALQLPWHLHRRDASLQREVKPYEMDAHGLVWMPAARMLDGIGVHRQLMRLSEKNGVLELRSQHLLEHRPALCRGVKLTVVAALAQRHLEATSGASSHL